MNFKDMVNDRAIEIGKLSVRMTTASGSGHPSTALSLVHIVTVLMYKKMRYDVNDPWNPNSDRLVLSEGHAVPVVYAAYADLGGVVGKTTKDARKLTKDEVDTLREIDSVLDGHPNPAEGFPFFDAATGSLGQGLSAAAGLGLAARKSGSDKMIYVICGDGESREGQIWEAADFLADNNLTNVCLIINCNGQGQADYVSKQQSAKVLDKKLQAYGWDTEIIDGHDPEKILSTLEKAGQSNKPLAILAQTTKGWGVEALKAHTNHGKPLPKEKLASALSDLDAMRAKLGITGDLDTSELRPGKPGDSHRSFATPTQTFPAADFDKLLDGDAFLPKWQSNKKLASRRAAGLGLREMAKIDERIVSLDCDVSNSTFSMYIKDAGDDKFFECKIAEQNMISAAVGFSAAGYIPFVSSFGKFLVRGYDQIEMAVISRANIKFIGSHVGVTLAADGPSQMGLVDMAFFRTFSSAHEDGQPMMVIFNPADAVCGYKCVKLAAERKGMCYIRTMRPDTPLLYKADEEFTIGGSKKLIDGTDLVIVATGYMVHEAIKAIEQLKADGISASLIDAYSLPLDANPILKAAETSGNKILTLEDNYIGGLASNVAEIAAAQGNIKVKSMVVSRVPKSGKTPDDLLAYCGLTKKDITEKAKLLANS